ncbi:hypothetical protein STEG23_009138, partial [Scotinomys teguina]
MEIEGINKTQMLRILEINNLELQKQALLAEYYKLKRQHQALKIEKMDILSKKMQHEEKLRQILQSPVYHMQSKSISFEMKRTTFNLDQTYCQHLEKKDCSLCLFALTLTGKLVFCLHVYLCEGVGSPGTGITDSCELP